MWSLRGQPHTCCCIGSPNRHIRVRMDAPVRPGTAVLVQVPGSDRYADEESVPDGRRVPGLIVYRFDSPLTFAHVDIAIDQLNELIETSEPAASVVLFDAEAVTDIDVTALDESPDMSPSFEDEISLSV